MGDLLIRNMSDLLKRDLEQAADKSGRSLSDEAKELLRRGLIEQKNVKPAEEQSAYDLFRAAFHAEDGIGDEFADMMEDIEAARKKDFGRAHERLP